jgi:enoyl-[acyl-carrier protein] reductase II
LVPMVKSEISVPLIAAGGIGTGRGMLAAMALGADAVQIGSRFAASKESSAHANFKQAIFQAKDGDTKLMLKQLIPVRLIKNEFVQKVQEMENTGADKNALQNFLGHGRAKLGMFEGDLQQGELEIGQISGLIHELKSIEAIFEEIIGEFVLAQKELNACKII